MAQVFTLFPYLPFEIRAKIWHFALPEDEPEVVIHPLCWISEPTQIPLDFKDVAAGFPALMHTCRESRKEVLMYGGLIFRSIPGTPCEIPFRPFRPELDTVYWDLLPHAVMGVFHADEYHAWLKTVQHMAIQMPAVAVFAHTINEVIEMCPSLRTLSMLVSPSSHQFEMLPTLRHRLVDPQLAPRSLLTGLVNVLRNKKTENGRLPRHPACITYIAQKLVNWQGGKWVDIYDERRLRFPSDIAEILVPLDGGRSGDLR